MSTVILTGMPDEKRVMRSAIPGLLILSGTDKLNLPALVPADCQRIVCAGLFGGLAPGIAVGDVCVAASLIDQGGENYSCDSNWNASVMVTAARAGINITLQPWYSSGITEGDTAAQRFALFQKYGATCIDDEARFAMALALSRGIACNDFRSCSDDYHMTLPAEARGNVLKADGSPNLDYLAETFRLKDVPALLQVATDYKKSLDALEAAAQACVRVFST